jgi:hypothetical protein
MKTVAQVIDELSRMPQDMRVLVSEQTGRLSDFDDAEVVSFPKGDFPPLDEEEIELDGVYVVIHGTGVGGLTDCQPEFPELRERGCEW